MNLLSRLRKPFVFAVLVSTLMLSSAFLPSNRGGSALEACAASGYNYSRIYTYYNDAAHTTEVGWRYINCAGRVESSSGITSPYYTYENINVCCGTYEC